MINEKVSNEELEAFIAEPVNGMVMMPNRDLAVAMAKELLAFRKASSEPVADVVPWSHPTKERTCDIRWRRHDVAPGPLYTAAHPEPSYPEKLPCPALLEPGMRFGKGVATSTVLKALQRRADHYAELEAMTPEERAEHEASVEEFRSMLPARDERKEYEVFMEERFSHSVDRRRALNGDNEYMAWDMAMGWVIWQHRAAISKIKM